MIEKLIGAIEKIWSMDVIEKVIGAIEKFINNGVLIDFTSVVISIISVVIAIEVSKRQRKDSLWNERIELRNKCLLFFNEIEGIKLENYVSSEKVSEYLKENDEKKKGEIVNSILKNRTEEYNKKIDKVEFDKIKLDIESLFGKKASILFPKCVDSRRLYFINEVAAKCFALVEQNISSNIKAIKGKLWRASEEVVETLENDLKELEHKYNKYEKKAKRQEKKYNDTKKKILKIISKKLDVS